MSFKQYNGNEIKVSSAVWLAVGLAFGIWLWLWRGFVAGQYTLLLDAQAYYEHFKFFIDQLSQGVYPLWDPSRQHGVPMEFFLRRIGSFNPLFFIILVLYKSGVSFWFAYSAFMCLYYFLGMLGVFLIGIEVFKDVRTAYVLYVGLLFSSLASLLYNSFIILEFTPMIWFLYCLIKFLRQPDKVNVLGMTFTLMVLLSTYIPFYFITVFLSLGLFVILCFWREVMLAVKQARLFIMENKIFTLFCIICVLISCLPALLFFKEMSLGNLVMPVRHGGSGFEHGLTVAQQTTAKGGVVATHFWKEIFFHIDRIQLGRFYIPIFIHICFLLGLFVKTTRRITALALWAFFIYMMSVYEASPIYRFLYKYVFYFKYFRNFQFFLWLILLPVYIFLSAEHLGIVIDKLKQRKSKNLWALGLSLIHLGLGIWLTLNDGVIPTTYVVIILSWIFFLSLIYLPNKMMRSHSPATILSCLLILLALQPLEVYSYLHKNAYRYEHRVYRYDEPYLHIKIPSSEQLKSIQALSQKDLELNRKLFFTKNRPHVYIGTKWYVFLRENMNLQRLSDYMASPFMLYDNTTLIDEDNLDEEQVYSTFVQQRNHALLPSDTPEDFIKSHPHSNNLVTTLDNLSSEIKVKYVGVNDIILQTRLKQEKFLVHNDTFYPGWRATIDGQPAEVLRANIAFRGMWIPKGEHEIHFRFGSPTQYIFQYLMMALFIIVFLIWIWQALFKHIFARDATL